MKTLLYLCLAAVATYAGVQAARPIWQATYSEEVPGLLNVCGDLYDMEEQISHSDWWPALIRHIKHEHPGYCLMTLSVVNLDHGMVIMYSVKSPDGGDIISSHMDCNEHSSI